MCKYRYSARYYIIKHMLLSIALRNFLKKFHFGYAKGKNPVSSLRHGKIKGGSAYGECYT